MFLHQKKTSCLFYLLGAFFLCILGEVKPSFGMSQDFSPSLDPLWVQGKVLCQAGEYQKSLRFLMDLLGHTEEGKTKAHILFWIGKSWEGTGDFDRAQESYVAALRANPGFPELSRVLAAHEGEAIPLWDHVATPEESLSLAKASKPPYSEYTLVNPPVLPIPIMPPGGQETPLPSREVRAVPTVAQSQIVEPQTADPFLVSPSSPSQFDPSKLGKNPPTYMQKIEIQPQATSPLNANHLGYSQNLPERQKNLISLLPVAEETMISRKPAYIPPSPQRNYEEERPVYTPPIPDEVLLSKDSPEAIPFQEGGSKKPLYIPPPPPKEEEPQKP